MKFLTSNGSGKEIIGGITTHLREHVRHSPQHRFEIIEINGDQEYVQKDNQGIHSLNLESLIGEDTLRDYALEGVRSLTDFERKCTPIINEYQKILLETDPDAILIFGTSLTSYFLLKAAEKEDRLRGIVHSYSGVIEKETAEEDKSRELLKKVGRYFTRKHVRDQVTYIFPSELCKKTIEEIHKVSLPNAQIIPNGVSSEFNRGKRVPPKAIKLGFVGRISPVKNVDFFLDLPYRIGLEYDLGIVTDIAAAASKPSGKKLLRKMTRGEIEYMHPRQPQDLARVYKEDFSAIVVPSHFETFCNVAVESAVCGTPTLLTDKAGATEVYRKYGLDEFIFSIEDMRSFKKAFHSALMSDFRIDSRVSQEMYKELNWRNIIRRYNNVAQSVLSRNC